MAGSGLLDAIEMGVFIAVVVFFGALMSGVVAYIIGESLDWCWYKISGKKREYKPKFFEVFR